MPYKNRPGQSTREMAKSRRRTTNLILMGALLLAIVLGLAVQNSRNLGLSGGLVLVLIVLLRILPDLVGNITRKRDKAERRADRGAAAEEFVGDILANLGEDFYVLNDIPSPYGNIDHIVVARHGVFLLETKSHGGRVEILSNEILVNGKPPEKDFIAQALKNTYWLREQIERVAGIKIWITPVIVFTNAFVESGKPIKGVRIINKKYLSNFLNRQAQSDPKFAKVWESKEQIAGELQKL